MPELGNSEESIPTTSAVIVLWTLQSFHVSFHDVVICEHYHCDWDNLWVVSCYFSDPSSLSIELDSSFVYNRLASRKNCCSMINLTQVISIANYICKGPGFARVPALASFSDISTLTWSVPAPENPEKRDNDEFRADRNTGKLQNNRPKLSSNHFYHSPSKGKWKKIVHSLPLVHTK